MTNTSRQIFRILLAGALGAAALFLATLASGEATALRHIEAARQWLAARKPEPAEAELRAERALFPDNPNGLELWARVLVVRRDKVPAEAALRRVAATSAQPGPALRLLGNTLAEELGKEAQGAEALERGLELGRPATRQEAAIAWLELGQTALKGGDLGRAAWALRRAQEASAPRQYLVPALIQCYDRLGLRDAAAAIRADPTLALTP